MNLVSRPDMSLWLPPNLWESKLLTLFFVGPIDEDVQTPVSVPKGRVSGSTWMQADEMLESQAAAGKALQENHFQGGTCLRLCWARVDSLGEVGEQEAREAVPAPCLLSGCETPDCKPCWRSEPGIQSCRSHS